VAGHCCFRFDRLEHKRCDGTRGPLADAGFVSAVEQRIESLPQLQGSFTVISARFLRARSERRSNNRRAVLLEYRFRILAN